MTSIGILGGTGEHGRGLAQRFSAAGARVIVGSRDPLRQRETVAKWETAGQSIVVAHNAVAVEHSDLTVLAVPFTSVDTLLTEVHSQFRDTSIVRDVTVPVTFSGGRVTMVEVDEGSVTEHHRSVGGGGQPDRARSVTGRLCVSRYGMTSRNRRVAKRHVFTLL